MHPAIGMLFARSRWCVGHEDLSRKGEVLLKVCRPEICAKKLNQKCGKDGKEWWQIGTI